MKRLKIGTRKSQLAQIQAKILEKRIIKSFPKVETELVLITTTGDQKNTQRFIDMDEKSLFTKELDEALLSNKIDLAVHSLKDIPSDMPEGVSLTAVLCGDEYRDAFVSTRYSCFEDMPAGGVVGTSSTRRIALIASKFPELTIKTIRGNVDSRLAKLDSGEFDAIVLSAAGLHRMNLKERVTQYLDPNWFTPSIGQGFMGVTSCTNDKTVRDILSLINESKEFASLMGLRMFMKELQGGCSVPLGAYAVLEENGLEFKAFLGTPNASTSIRGCVNGSLQEAHKLALDLRDQMNEQGAQEILANVKGK